MSAAPKDGKIAWPLLAILALQALVQWPHLHLDFWNDELYTLSHFVLPPMRHTITDYHVPNNHILFSLAAHLWASIAGIHSMPDALSHIVWMRLLPFFCSCGSLSFVYLAARKTSGNLAAPLAALLLLTSIPFYNFSAQMRGYSLSMCAFAALGYAVITASQKPGLARLSAIFMLSLACVYTLPSNLLFMAAALAAAGGSAFILARPPGMHAMGFTLRKTLLLSAAMAAGMAAAALLYLPVLPQMRAWQQISAKAPAALGNVRHAMPIVGYHFLSARWLMALPLLWFLWKGRGLRSLWLWNMAVLFCLPFLLSDLQAEAPPHRVFLTALPLLCLGLAMAVRYAVKTIENIRLRLAAFAVLGLYCLLVFGFQLRKTRQTALADMTTGTRRLDLYYQYSLQFFTPQADAKLYLRAFARPGIPLINACAGEEDLTKYLAFEGGNRILSHMPLADALLQFDTLDVITEQPSALRDSLQSRGIHRSTKALLQGTHRIQIMRLTKQES